MIRYLFWSTSCPVDILMERVVKQPAVILKTVFRDKIMASGVSDLCQQRSAV